MTGVIRRLVVDAAFPQTDSQFSPNVYELYLVVSPCSPFPQYFSVVLLARTLLHEES